MQYFNKRIVALSQSKSEQLSTLCYGMTLIFICNKQQNTHLNQIHAISTFIFDQECIL